MCHDKHGKEVRIATRDLSYLLFVGELIHILYRVAEFGTKERDNPGQLHPKEQ